MALQVEERGLFVGGQWVQPMRGGRYPVTNPATEQVIGSIPAATAEDVDLAVKAAAQRQPEWKKTTGAQRARLLRAIADKVRAGTALAGAACGCVGAPVAGTHSCGVVVVGDAAQLDSSSRHAPCSGQPGSRPLRLCTVCRGGAATAAADCTPAAAAGWLPASRGSAVALAICPAEPACLPGQVVERKSALARLESLDCGKPIAEAEWDMVRGLCPT